MTYRMLHDGAVYDGPVYLGMVYAGFADGFDVWLSGRIVATLPTKQDAVEWLVCEYRATPWAGRPEAQRIAANDCT